MEQAIDLYFTSLAELGRNAACTDAAGKAQSLSAGFSWVISQLARVKAEDRKVMFIGNGGSAGICSHMAIDFTKNGGFGALAFNDGAALTCLGNDLGYDQVFAKQVQMHGRSGDLLIAISSSGNSVNILNGVAAARARGCVVATFSGFKPDNRLRVLGDVNFFVASHAYGFVETAHQALIHAILDFTMGFADELLATERGAKTLSH
jgi:D-sedoheptulose 7-phosphate isomerase